MYSNIISVYNIALHRITEGQTQCGFYTQGSVIFLPIALTESQKSNARDLKGPVIALLTFLKLN